MRCTFIPPLAIGFILASHLQTAHTASLRCWGKTATIVGTPRDETLRGTPGADVIVGGEGKDTISGGGGGDRICGGLGGDLIRGRGGSDSIKGGRGLDELRGGRGKDRIRTGQATGWRGGPDEATGGLGSDTLIGDEGINSIRGGAGNDIISGHGATWDGCDCDVEFADLLIGGEDDDVIKGGETAGRNVGGEILVGGRGDDVIDGGESGDGLDGFDVASFAGAHQPVDINLASGVAVGHGSDTLMGIAAAFGSPEADRVKGDTNQNWLGGASGEDSIFGGKGDDILGIHVDQSVAALDFVSSVDPFGLKGMDFGSDVMSGGDGDDVFVGSELATEDDGLTSVPGNDRLHGGTGVDWVTFDCSCAPLDLSVTVDLAAGTAEGWGTDSLGEIENIVGSVHSDVLIGDDGPNGIFGRGGDDALSGLGGDDSLDGGDGNNTIDGGAGTDNCLNPDAAGGAVACEAP